MLFNFWHWICAGAVTVALASTMAAFLGRRVLDLATGSSGPRKAKAPAGIEEVNSSVWKFCSPPAPDVDIIFFHGLQLGDFEDAFWKTWRARNDSEVVWPKDWLSKRFPHARILSISYNSSATRPEGQTDMYALGENLVSDIILESKLDIGQNRPVFLVGHSLGGIILKQFILMAVKKRSLKEGVTKHGKDGEKISTFLKNFRGAFYYATPHAGAELADAALTELVGNLVGTSPILGLLKTLDTKRQLINEKFENQLHKSNSRSYAVVEGQRTTYKCFKGKWVVESASATQDVNDSYTNTTADHFSVCKASNMNDPVIGRLCDFISAEPNIMYKPAVIDSESDNNIS